MEVLLMLQHLFQMNVLLHRKGRPKRLPKNWFMMSPINDVLVVFCLKMSPQKDLPLFYVHLLICSRITMDLTTYQPK